MGIMDFIRFWIFLRNETYKKGFLKPKSYIKLKVSVPQTTSVRKFEYICLYNFWSISFLLTLYVYYYMSEWRGSLHEYYKVFFKVYTRTTMINKLKCRVCLMIFGIEGMFGFKTHFLGYCDLKIKDLFFRIFYQSFWIAVTKI